MFNCGFSIKMTCAFLLQENPYEIWNLTLFNLKKGRYLQHYWSDKGAMGAIVNPALPFMEGHLQLHLQSLELILELQLYLQMGVSHLNTDLQDLIPRLFKH